MKKTLVLAFTFDGGLASKLARLFCQRSESLPLQDIHTQTSLLSLFTKSWYVIFFLDVSVHLCICLQKVLHFVSHGAKSQLLSKMPYKSRLPFEQASFWNSKRALFFTKSGKANGCLTKKILVLFIPYVSSTQNAKILSHVQRTRCPEHGWIWKKTNITPRETIFLPEKHHLLPSAPQNRA